MLDAFLNDEGRLLTRPTDTKTQADLDRIISLGKPQSVVDTTRNLVNISLQWDYCYSYIYFLNDKIDWDSWETTITLDVEGVEASRTEKPDEPIEPEKPEPVNVSPVYMRVYPSTGDQLDYIYHNGLAKWKTDIIKPIKDAHPKP